MFVFNIVKLMSGGKQEELWSWFPTMLDVLVLSPSSILVPGKMNMLRCSRETFFLIVIIWGYRQSEVIEWTNMGVPGVFPMSIVILAALPGQMLLFYAVLCDYGHMVFPLPFWGPVVYVCTAVMFLSLTRVTAVIFWVFWCPRHFLVCELSHSKSCLNFER